MISIREVAACAGVSMSTVSRVLNHGANVSDSKRQRVLEAVERLQYRPNYFAKALKDGTSKTIALIVPNISNPIYAMIIQGIEEVVRVKGYNVILCNTNEDLNTELDCIKVLTERQAAGFIFATVKQEAKHLLELVRAGVPVVEVLRYSPGLDAVSVDNFQIGYEAASYLLKHGHRKIFVFSDDARIAAFRLRVDGYKQALADHGVPFEPYYEFAVNSTDYKVLRRATLERFAAHGIPDAVFCVSDPKALGIYGAAKELGLRIPQDISVFGVDNLDFSQFLNPPLTTISQPFYAMGGKAAELLIRKIEDGSRASDVEGICRITMPTKLIERESVLQRTP